MVLGLWVSIYILSEQALYNNSVLLRDWQRLMLNL